MTNLKIFLLLPACYILFMASGWGQCPEKSVLWKRIAYLRDSSKVASSDQLTELFPYLEKIKACPGRNDSTHTMLLLRVAWLLSVVKKDHPTAIGYTNQAIGIIRGHSGEPGTSQRQLVRSFNNLRIYYDSLRQQSLGKEAADSCIAIALRLGTGLDYAAELIGKRTPDLYKSGDYYRCIAYATLAEDMSRKGGLPPGNIYYYLTWRINSLLKLKKYDESAKLSEKALAECQEKGHKEYLGVLYDFLARANAAKGDSGKAVLYSQRSFTYNERIGNYKGCAETLINLGDVLYFKHLHQYNSALRCFNKALRYAITPDSIALFDNIAKVYVEKGLFDPAFYYFKQAFGVLGAGMDEKKLLQSGAAGLVDRAFVDNLVEMILDKGDAYLKKYKSFREKEISEDKAFGATASLLQAVATYTTIDQLLDKIRTTQAETFSKLFWRANYRHLYENAIEACYLYNNTAQAFYFFEKSKAALLGDQLSEQRWMDNEEILGRAGVSRRIAWLGKQLSGLNPASGGQEVIERELFSARQDLERRERIIKKKYPHYYQNFMDTSLIGLRNVQGSLLVDHQAFLELFSGDKAVYTLLTDRSGSHLSRIDKHDFDSTLRLYLTALSNPDQLNGHFGDFTKAAGHLYQMIFGDRPLPAGRIIISPDGRFFPFEALVVKNDTRNPVYFLEGHAVSYIYSARYLLNHSDTSPTRVNGDFLGVAPVQYSAGLGLPALPGSEHSLGRIASYFGSTSSLLSAQATRNNFLHQFYGFRIIQLYTHASDGLRSAAGLRSIGDAVGRARDSLGSGAIGNSSDPLIWFADSSLSLTDLIPDSKPVTRLIVLSACETGNGRVYEGEGVFSFNRGFAAIGIPSSVTNLWAVDDQSTYRITELFYHHLSEGMPLDLALQRAKTDYIKNSSHEKALPYYWAAPILSGDTQAIKFRPAHSLLREILIVLSILALALLLRWGWKRVNG